MSQISQPGIPKLLEQAVFSLKEEIATVRERPSSDVLFNGILQAPAAAVADKWDYKFETHQPAIRFAEEIRAVNGNGEWMLTPVSWAKNEIVLRFPEKLGDTLDEIQVEWENDFVLQRTLKELERLQTADDHVLDRIRLLFEPESENIPSSAGLLDDGLRNEAQQAAISKSMRRRTVYIWGPPGTGKTATLGFVIANYLKEGKRVLFASNTNRAVDVGLLSAIQALDEIGFDIDKQKLTRFGEAALDEKRVTDLMFTKQMEEMSEKRRSEAATLAALLDRLKEVGTSIEKRLTDGKQPTEEQNMEMELIDRKIREEGGREFLEERMEELSTVNERAELTGKQLVATTLAKVCTSDLFGNVDFDAVVIDEGSMAGLPYLMVTASRAKWHRVIVGDPMQLPPIALTEKKEAREFLEKDIFTSVSGADTTESLFAWHDSQPGFTCFFDIQYRLEPALADVISKVFYDGRLRSGREKGDGGDIHADNRSYHLIDTSRYRPVLTQKSGERGFQPVNTVHQEVLERLIGNMLGKGIPPGDIGVMVPFRSPVYDLRNRLYEASMHGVEVGTIHTFQGREKPYIIFDTVMSGETRNGSIRHYSVRPLDESKNGLSVPRLLNVAFSRSRKELMILADMRHIHTVYGNKFLGKLLNRMKS